MSVTAAAPVVAVHGQLLPESAGGIASNLIGLLHGLAGEPTSGSQIVIGPGSMSGWLQEHLGPRQTVLEWRPIAFHPFPPPTWFPARLWRSARRAFGRRLDGLLSGPEPEHVVEGRRLTAVLRDRGVQLVHFPYQRFFATDLPYIFEPWDLQHRHHPEFFTDEEIELREQLYPAACNDARLIVTATQWSKDDLLRQFGIDPGRVEVIPRAPYLPGPPPDRGAARERVRMLGLPPRFVVYPAKPWPHKNHARLLQALARVARSGEEIPLVCTSAPVEAFSRVAADAARLGMADQVHFTGHLPAADLQKVLVAADVLVFPSLFEGLGIPLLEAMQLGVPIVCSNVCCLPEIVGDAAVFFDATSPEAIADALRAAWASPELRNDLAARGLRVASRYSWTHAGHSFAAVYSRYTDSHISSTASVSSLRE